jgi:hypothetical protein
MFLLGIMMGFDDRDEQLPSEYAAIVSKEYTPDNFGLLTEGQQRFHSDYFSLAVMLSKDFGLNPVHLGSDDSNKPMVALFFSKNDNTLQSIFAETWDTKTGGSRQTGGARSSSQRAENATVAGVGLLTCFVSAIAASVIR